MKLLLPDPIRKQGEGIGGEGGEPGMKTPLHPHPHLQLSPDFQRVCVGKPSRSQRALWKSGLLGEKRRGQKFPFKCLLCARYFAYSHASGLGMHTNLGASADPILANSVVWASITAFCASVSS